MRHRDLVLRVDMNHDPIHKRHGGTIGMADDPFPAQELVRRRCHGHDSKETDYTHKPPFDKGKIGGGGGTEGERENSFFAITFVFSSLGTKKFLHYKENFSLNIEKMETLRVTLKALQDDVSAGQLSTEALRLKYSEFADRYPTLYALALQKNLDPAKLEMMLGMFSRISGGEMTYEDASKDVGQRLFDEFVKPLVEK